MLSFLKLSFTKCRVLSRMKVTIKSRRNSKTSTKRIRNRKKLEENLSLIILMQQFRVKNQDKINWIRICSLCGILTNCLSQISQIREWLTKVYLLMRISTLSKNHKQTMMKMIKLLRMPQLSKRIFMNSMAGMPIYHRHTMLMNTILKSRKIEIGLLTNMRTMYNKSIKSTRAKSHLSFSRMEEKKKIIHRIKKGKGCLILVVEQLKTLMTPEIEYNLMHHKW